MGIKKIDSKNNNVNLDKFDVKKITTLDGLAKSIADNYKNNNNSNSVLLVENYDLDDPMPIVVDQFEPSKSYFNHIKKSPKQVTDILFLTKAEDQCLSVACSSLISRYIFLKEMDKLSQKLGITLPKGANPKVDEIAKSLVEKYGQDKLKEIAKLNFKNTEKILK